MRYQNVVRFGLILSIACTFLFFSSTSSAAEKSTLQPGEVVVTVDGHAVEARKGLVIAQGIRVATGRCKIGDVHIHGRSSAALPTGSITLSVNQACELFVKELQFTSSSQLTGSGALRDITYLRGYALATYEEQFSLDVTKVYVSMDYTDYGTGLSNGRNPYDSCWGLPETLWTVEQCGPYNWDPYGPVKMWISSSGLFSNPFGPDHGLFAHFEAYAGYTTDWYCDQWGSDWPYWDLSCSGGAAII